MRIDPTSLHSPELLHVLGSPAGQQLYQKSLLLFDIVKDIQNNIASDSNMFNGNISIACLSQVSACYLARHVAGFRACYPQVTFTINTGMSSMRSASLPLGTRARCRSPLRRAAARA